MQEQQTEQYTNMCILYIKYTNTLYSIHILYTYMNTIQYMYIDILYTVYISMDYTLYTLLQYIWVGERDSVHCRQRRYGKNRRPL